jgi:hypothetical protein
MNGLRPSLLDEVERSAQLSRRGLEDSASPPRITEGIPDYVLKGKTERIHVAC